MRIKTLVIKILAPIGTVLVWFPVLAPFLVMVRYLNRTPDAVGSINFDYLIPAELFPIALLGGGLLILTVLLAGHSGRLYRYLIFWGLGAAVVLLVGGQSIAVVSGLASGAIQPPSIWWDIVLGMLAGYVLGLVVAGVGGVLLLRDLFFPVRLTIGTKS